MPFCPQCGEASDARSHARCEELLRMEPPRFCARCRRRMVVQVVPTGWTAKCVEHGELHSAHR